MIAYTYIHLPSVYLLTDSPVLIMLLYPHLKLDLGFWACFIIGGWSYYLLHPCIEKFDVYNFRTI